MASPGAFGRWAAGAYRTGLRRLEAVEKGVKREESIKRIIVNLKYS